MFLLIFKVILSNRSRSRYLIPYSYLYHIIFFMKLFIFQSCYNCISRMVFACVILPVGFCLSNSLIYLFIYTFLFFFLFNASRCCYCSGFFCPGCLFNHSNIFYFWCVLLLCGSSLTYLLCYFFHF